MKFSQLKKNISKRRGSSSALAQRYPCIGAGAHYRNRQSSTISSSSPGMVNGAWFFYVG